MSVLERLMTLMARLKDESSGHGDRAELAQSLLTEMTGIVGALEDVQQTKRRGAGQIDYLVERTPQGEVLTERRRTGKSEKFRCPKLVYEAMAAVLAESDRSLSADEITATVERRIGLRPPDYQVRVALRFWLSVDPHVLIRNRARYRPISSNRFEKMAREFWNGLRQ